MSRVQYDTEIEMEYMDLQERRDNAFPRLDYVLSMGDELAIAVAPPELRPFRRYAAVEFRLRTLPLVETYIYGQCHSIEAFDMVEKLGQRVAMIRDPLVRVGVFPIFAVEPPPYLIPDVLKMRDLLQRGALRETIRFSQDSPKWLDDAADRMIGNMLAIKDDVMHMLIKMSDKIESWFASCGFHLDHDYSVLSRLEQSVQVTLARYAATHPKLVHLTDTIIDVDYSLSEIPMEFFHPFILRDCIHNPLKRFIRDYAKLKEDGQ